MSDFLLNQMPFLADVTQFTLVGLAAVFIALVLYLTTQIPELLLVIFTAALYITVPHLPHLL